MFIYLLFFNIFAISECQSSLIQLLDIYPSQGTPKEMAQRLKKLIVKYDYKNILDEDKEIQEITRIISTRGKMSFVLKNDELFTYLWSMIHIWGKLGFYKIVPGDILRDRSFQDLYHIPSSFTLKETLKLVSLHVYYYIQNTNGFKKLDEGGEFLRYLYNYWQSSGEFKQHTYVDILEQLNNLKYTGGRNLYKLLSVKLFTANLTNLNNIRMLLKAIRFRHLYSEKEVSQILGFRNSNMLLGWENGSIELSMDKILKLIDFYKVLDRSLFPSIDRKASSFFDNLIQEEENALNNVTSLALRNRFYYFLNRASFKSETLATILHKEFDEDAELLSLNKTDLLKAVAVINYQLKNIGYHVNILQPRFFPELFTLDDLNHQSVEFIRMHILHYMRYYNISFEDLASDLKGHLVLVKRFLTHPVETNSSNIQNAVSMLKFREIIKTLKGHESLLEMLKLDDLEKRHSVLFYTARFLARFRIEW